MFGSGSGSQRLKVSLGVVLGVVTVGVGVALSGLGDNAGSAKTWLVASLVITWGVSLFALLTTGNGKGSSLHAATEAAEALARLDLTHAIPNGGSDDVGRLLTALDGTQRSLQKLIGDVRGAADSIGTASAEIATGNLDLSQRTEQTASNLQNAASSMA